MALRCSEQLKNTITSSKLKNDNQGFSLVEVLIAVFVLAIVFTPVMKSFMVASLTNSRAQSTQNATSLAETIMEEVKGNSIEDLYKSSLAGAANKPKFLDNGGSISFKCGTTPEPPTSFATAAPPYIIEYTGVTATQGQSFDVKVKISTDEYSIEDTTGTNTEVSDANLWELPELSKLNAADNPVISWEINRYDNIAMSQLAYQNAKKENDATEENTIISYAQASGVKTITIEISDVSGTDKFKVSCSVKYSTGNTAYKIPIDYVVYSEYFDKPATPNTPNAKLYIFYTNSAEYLAGESISDNYFKKEDIVIDDKSSNKHDVYFMRQEDSNHPTKALSLKDTVYNVNTTITTKGYTQNMNSVSNITTKAAFELSPGADNDYNTVEDNLRLFSNLKYSVGTEERIGTLYRTEKKDRIYYVTVNVYTHEDDEAKKYSDERATLTSTVQAGSEADK